MPRHTSLGSLSRTVSALLIEAWQLSSGTGWLLSGNARLFSRVLLRSVSYVHTFFLKSKYKFIIIWRSGCSSSFYGDYEGLQTIKCVDILLRYLKEARGSLLWCGRLPALRVPRPWRIYGNWLLAQHVSALGNEGHLGEALWGNQRNRRTFLPQLLYST